MKGSIINFKTPAGFERTNPGLLSCWLLQWPQYLNKPQGGIWFVAVAKDNGWFVIRTSLCQRIFWSFNNKQLKVAFLSQTRSRRPWQPGAAAKLECRLRPIRPNLPACLSSLPSSTRRRRCTGSPRECRSRTSLPFRWTGRPSASTELPAGTTAEAKPRKPQRPPRFLWSLPTGERCRFPRTCWPTRGPRPTSTTARDGDCWSWGRTSTTCSASSRTNERGILVLVLGAAKKVRMFKVLPW